jgi:hypothetical protein
MPSIDFDQALHKALTQRAKAAESNVKRIYSKKDVEQGILEAFELVGGVSRLAIWANDPANYGEFLKLYVKCLPKDVAKEEGGRVINYMSSIPDSPLNDPKPDHLVRKSSEDIEDVDSF